VTRRYSVSGLLAGWTEQSQFGDTILQKSTLSGACCRLGGTGTFFKATKQSQFGDTILQKSTLSGGCCRLDGEGTTSGRRNKANSATQFYRNRHFSELVAGSAERERLQGGETKPIRRHNSTEIDAFRRFLPA
jgi:hypothetical protein